MRPKTLYKYLSPERIDVLQATSLRFTQVSALNDPFESLPGIMLESRDWYMQKFRERVSGELARLGIRGESKRKQYWRARKKDFEHFLKCYTDINWLTEQSQLVQHMSDTVHGCLSLSATCTNILMWSHYARHHKGYVIGFDAEHEYFKMGVDPVIYSQTRPPHNVFESSHDGDLFYTKSVDWAYEQEYRKFQALVESVKLKDGGGFLPYTEQDSKAPANSAVVLFPFPPEAIQCVILGWKSEPALRSAVVSEIENLGLSNVSLRKARPSLAKYEMEIVQA